MKMVFWHYKLANISGHFKHRILGLEEISRFGGSIASSQEYAVHYYRRLAIAPVSKQGALRLSEEPRDHNTIDDAWDWRGGVSTRPLQLRFIFVP